METPSGITCVSLTTTDSVKSDPPLPPPQPEKIITSNDSSAILIFVFILFLKLIGFEITQRVCSFSRWVMRIPSFICLRIDSSLHASAGVWRYTRRVTCLLARVVGCCHDHRRMGCRSGWGRWAGGDCS